MKKRLLWLAAIVAGFVIAVGFTTANAKADTKDVTTHKEDGTTETNTYTSISSWDQLPAATENAKNYVYLTADMNITSYSLAEGQELYIDLAGHTITITSNVRFFNVSKAGAKLVLTDSVGGGCLNGAGPNLGSQWAGYARFADQNAATTIILDGVKVYNGITGNNGGGFSVRADGAALYLFNTTIDTVKANYNGSVYGLGGAIWATKSTLVEMHDSTIVNCKTQGNGGGAVALQGTAVLKMYGTSTIKDCESLNSNSGAIWFGDTAKLEMHDSATIRDCKAKTNGGAISCASTNAYTIEMYDDAQIIDNYAPNLGANIVLNGGSLTMRGNAKITGGKADANDGSNGYAGNVRIMGGTLTMYDNAEISGGEVTRYAGNVSVTNGKIYMHGGTIKNGTAGSNGGNITFAGAGRLEMDGGTISGGTATAGFGGNVSFNTAGATFIFGGTAKIEGGSAPNGGSIHFQEAPAKVEITGGTITGGTATTGCGGNLNFSKSCTDVTISGGTISNGKASTHSGNIRFNGSTVTMSGNAKITGGETTGNHGGNVTCSGAFTMKNNAEISDGIAKTFAGNLYYDGAGLTMEDNAKIYGGSSGAEGGNLVLRAKLEMSGNASIYDGFSTTNGGNIVMDNTKSILIMSGSAKIYGGTVGPMTLNENGSVKTGFGANVNASSSAAITMSGDAEIKGGVATAYGGNIVLAATSTLTMSGNAAVKDGVAATNGGNITITGLGSLTMSDSAAITGGTAGAFGGNVSVNNGGTLIMNGGYITNGTAATNAGNVYLAAESGKTATFTVTAGQITDGTATGTDVEEGGTTVHHDPDAVSVYLTTNVNPTISGGYFDNIYGTAGMTKTEFITGGYFIDCPQAGYAAVVDGKTIIQGNEKSYTNPDPTDDHVYRYGFESVSDGVLIDAEAIVDLPGYTTTISGIGYYLPGQTFTLTAKAISGFAFDGWETAGGDAAGDELTITGTVSAPETYLAYFVVADGYFPVLVVPGNVASYSYKIGDKAAVEKTESFRILLKKGQELTLTNTTEENYYWVNESDKILKATTKDDADYTFTANGAVTILAKKVETTEDAVPVIYFTDFNQIYQIDSITMDTIEENDYALPAKPFRKGKDVTWKFTDDDGNELTDDADIAESILIAAYVMFEDEVIDTLTVQAESKPTEGATYAVVVKNAAGTELFAENVALGDTVTVVLPETDDGAKFLKVVDAAGNAIAYRRGFQFKAFTDTELTAVYGDGEAEADYVLAITATSGEGGVASFVATRNLAQGYTVIEQGILVTKNADGPMTLGAAGVKAAISNNHDLIGSTTVNVRTTGTVRATAYATVLTPEGETVTLYSATGSVTVQ